jgi:lysophospholipase L1-like esterase
MRISKILTLIIGLSLLTVAYGAGKEAVKSKTQPNPTEPNSVTRIMPLGDSITVGVQSTDFNGYRRPLALLLAKYKVNFVGSMHWAGNPDFDRDNEGHGGWKAGQIRDNVYNWLVANPADIVLLHIGTNDIVHNQKAEDIIIEIEQIVDEIHRYNSNVVIILAQIINWADVRSIQYQETSKLNNLIKKLSNKAYVVNMEGALNYPDDFSDILHPNDSGYNKMADVWFSALELIYFNK